MRRLRQRAAEEVIFGEITTGAANDLEHVTMQAKRIVMRFAMTNLGLRTFGKDDDSPYLGNTLGTGQVADYSAKMAERIDLEIERVTNEAYAVAKKVLNEHLDKVHELAAVLMEKETIDKEEFEQILKKSEQGKHSPF